MTRAEATKAVKRYVSQSWPVSSLTVDGAIRAAWAQSHIPNISLELFRELLAAQGYKPRLFGEVWIIQFPGREPARLADGCIAEGETT